MVAPASLSRRVFSTDVRLTLEVEGVVLPLSAVGPESLVLRSAQALRGGPGWLTISVDGEADRCEIMLADTPRPTRRIAYVGLPSAARSDLCHSNGQSPS